MSKKKPEHERCREWRKRMGLTVAELAEATGYSPRSLYWFELGQTPPRGIKDRRISDDVWKRFKMACAGAAATLNSRHTFDW